MKLVNVFDEEIEVVLHVNRYSVNDNLYIGIIEEESREPYANLTVNLREKLPENMAYVDTNNFPNAEAFIENNHLGKFVGIYGRSGYCNYPLYEFDREVVGC